MNRKFFNHLAASAAILAVSLAGGAANATTTASVNQTQVGIDESFVLSLETDQKQSQALPNLAPLEEDFEVLGTGQQSRTSIVNGVASSSSGWTVSLAPKRPGQSTIPAIEVGAESTQPIEIEVVDRGSVANTAGNTPSIELSVPDGPFYAQQEIPLTVRIFGAESIRGGELSLLDIADATVTPVDGETVQQITKDGKPTTVVEKTYRIKPQSSGSLTIPPIVLQGIQNAARDNRARSRDPFDALGLSGAGFNGSLFDNFFNRGKRVRLRSQSLTLQVEKRPDDIKGWFLPAKQVELAASWSPQAPIFRVGEAASRIVQLTALGASKEQLPELTISGGDGFDLYTDRTDEKTSNTDDGIVAIKQVSLSVIPTSVGEVTLPEIEVSWWDTQTNTEQTAVLPAETIQVLPGAAGTNLSAASSTEASEASAATDGSAGSVNRGESRTPNLQPIGSQSSLALAILGVLSLGLFAAYEVRRRMKNADGNRRVKSTESELRRACANQDAEIAYDRLQRLLAYQTDQSASSRGLSKKLQRAIEALEAHLFSGHSEQKGEDGWNGEALMAAYDDFTKREGRRSNKDTSQFKLPSLYPN